MKDVEIGQIVRIRTTKKNGETVEHGGHVVSVMSQYCRVRYTVGKTKKIWEGHVMDVLPFVEVSDG